MPDGLLREQQVVMKNFTVELAYELIECAGLNEKIGDPELLPSPSEVDASHAKWRETMIRRAKAKADIRISDGRAAKLIDVYLKAAFVCGGYHEHPKIISLHPPIDRILLKQMKSDQYQGLIDRIRTASCGQPMWKVECFWRGF